MHLILGLTYTEDKIYSLMQKRQLQKCQDNVFRCTNWMLMIFTGLAKVLKIQDIAGNSMKEGHHGGTLMLEISKHLFSTDNYCTYFYGGISAPGVSNCFFLLCTVGCWIMEALFSTSREKDLQIHANPGGLLLYSLNCQRAHTVQRGNKQSWCWGWRLEYCSSRRRWRQNEWADSSALHRYFPTGNEFYLMSPALTWLSLLHSPASPMKYEACWTSPETTLLQEDRDTH